MMTNLLKKGRVGLMVTGHREYWPQFAGAREGHLRNGEILAEELGRNDVEVVLFHNADGDQMVDSPEIARQAGAFFRAQGIDLLFVLIPAYAASGRFMLGLLEAGCPIIPMSFQCQYDIAHTKMVDGMQVGGICALMEAVQALRRCGIEPADILFGRMYPETRRFDQHLTQELSDWCRVACALRALRGAVFGSMGHTYEGMLDMNYDPTAFTRTYGIHIRYVEMCELVRYVDETTDQEVQQKVAEIASIFDFLGASYDPVTAGIGNEDVEWAARCAVGLDKLVERNGLAGLAYYYEGLDNHYERVASNLIVGNSLLTSKGVSLAGEHDMKTCVAMYIMSALGCGGSFAETGGVDFEANQFLVGHDGPHDIRIADGRPTIRGLGLYHGKRGHGISVEFSLKKGPMTMLGTGVDANGQFTLTVAEVESVEGPLPQTGNTMTRARIEGDVSRFFEDWCWANNNHHCALSIGHNGALIDKFGRAMGIPVRRVR